MSIRDHVRQAAQEIAARAKERLSHIERRLAEAKEQVAKIEAEHDAARLAPQRLSDFPIESGVIIFVPAARSKKAVCRRSGTFRAIRAMNSPLPSVRIRTSNSARVTANFSQRLR